MKLYAPSYYENFSCIAHRCRHSCCVGWEIDVDGETLKKYEGLTEGYGKEIAGTVERGETPRFRLTEGERCPHLDGSGLCRIITELGEEYLCDICREHPRFYLDTVRGREVGLGMACEEACRLILSSDGYGSFSEVGTLCAESTWTGFDTLPDRGRIYSVLSDGSLSYAERRERIGRDFGVSPSIRSDGEWRERLAALEYLDETHKSMFAVYSSDPTDLGESEKPLERALAYFVFRHCTEAWDEEELRVSLGFCLFCERLLASLAKAAGICREDELIPLARIVSEELEYSEDNTEAIKAEFWK